MYLPIKADFNQLTTFFLLVCDSGIFETNLGFQDPSSPHARKV